MLRVGRERALVPVLRELVIAELARRVTEIVRDVGIIVRVERLERRERRLVFAGLHQRIGGAIAVAEFLLGFLVLLFLGVAGSFCCRRAAASASGRDCGCRADRARRRRARRRRRATAQTATRRSGRLGDCEVMLSPLQERGIGVGMIRRIAVGMIPRGTAGRRVAFRCLYSTRRDPRAAQWLSSNRRSSAAARSAG